MPNARLRYAWSAAGDVESRASTGGQGARTPSSFFTGADVIRRGLIGADQPFLQKPFGPDELVQQVHALLNGQVEEVTGEVTGER
jgi:hypothetical protein